VFTRTLAAATAQTDGVEKMETNMYRIVECHNLTTKEVFWRVYASDQQDGIADYPTVIDAAKAVERFKAADARRARRAK
jgi:hypothetical protein